MFQLKKPNQTNLYVDLAIFAGFLVSTTPALTGMTIHEWLGLALGATLITHLLLHWKWVVAVTRRFFANPLHSSRWNYLLNLALFIAFNLIIFSGLMISKTVLPLFGLQGDHGFVWRWLHTQATNLTLLLVGLHVAMHWKWIANTFGRYITMPILNLFRRRERSQPQYVRVRPNDHDSA